MFVAEDQLWGLVFETKMTKTFVYRYSSRLQNVCLFKSQGRCLFESRFENRSCLDWYVRIRERIRCYNNWGFPNASPSIRRLYHRRYGSLRSPHNTPQQYAESRKIAVPGERANSEDCWPANSIVRFRACLCES